MITSNDCGSDLPRGCPCASATTDSAKASVSVRSCRRLSLISIKMCRCAKVGPVGDRMFIDANRLSFKLTPFRGAIYYAHKGAELRISVECQFSKHLTPKEVKIIYGLVEIAFSAVLYFFIKSIALSASLHR